ncbi:MAG: NAD(+) diphosphatase [Betaproteobacteria bacterium]|nr:NAD(+) diphosphatase [Betaproteobacteria bacterium]
MNASYSTDFAPAISSDCDGRPARWFVFHEGRMLVAVSGEELLVPKCAHLAELGLEPGRIQFLGTLNGEPAYAAEIATPHTPEGMAWEGLRALFGRFDEVLVGIASRASQLIEWDRTHQFCGRCGSPTTPRADERARTCPGCRLSVYPRINPAIMVLITNGRQVLLARKPASPKNRFSALAGFVEAGESLGQTVVRETREEVGVEVKNIRYFGSQSWPFPNSLMIAFTAEYAGGEVRPDGVEIEEARWFDPGELPNVPDRISISRWLIDSVCAELLDGRRN